VLKRLKLPADVYCGHMQETILSIEPIDGCLQLMGACG